VYAKHPVFEEPANTSVKIWRYQSLEKFEDLLSKQALFFVSVDRLREWDKFEASYPESYRSLREIALEKRANALKLPEAIRQQLDKFDYNFRTATTRCVVINCWHINDWESAAMWKIYTRQEKGIAIQSSFSRLVKCFEKNQKDEVFIGKVKYIDYNKETFPVDNFFFPYVYKRKSFEYEQELRAAILKFPLDDRNQLDLSIAPYGKLRGTYVNIDPDTLIENVYISPEAEASLADKVGSILEGHEFKKTVTMSDLSKNPLY